MNTRTELLRPTRLLAPALAALTMTGCVFDSPYWGQSFSSTTASIPIQTWTTDKTRVVKIECHKASHAGLYPWGGPESWVHVVDITPSANASYDPKSGVVYSAGTPRVLPASCWHADAAYTPPKYTTALRATQLTASGSTTVYRVFDAAGLECLGREIGKGQSWFAWLSKSCALTYSGSTTLIPYVKIVTDTLGAAASASASMSLVASDFPARLKLDDERARWLADVFAGQRRDDPWAAGMEARLRNAYDVVVPDGTQLMDVACRATLCRVEVVHKDGLAQERFVQALAPSGLFSNDGHRGFAVHAGGKGGLSSVYYLAREGQGLPAPK